MRTSCSAPLKSNAMERVGVGLSAVLMFLPRITLKTAAAISQSACDAPRNRHRGMPTYRNAPWGPCPDHRQPGVPPRAAAPPPQRRASWAAWPKPRLALSWFLHQRQASQPQDLTTWIAIWRNKRPLSHDVKYHSHRFNHSNNPIERRVCRFLSPNFERGHNREVQLEQKKNEKVVCCNTGFSDGLREKH